MADKRDRPGSVARIFLACSALLLVLPQPRTSAAGLEAKSVMCELGAWHDWSIKRLVGCESAVMNKKNQH